MQLLKYIYIYIGRLHCHVVSLELSKRFVKLCRKCFSITLQMVLLIDDLNQYKTKSWYILARSPLLTKNIFCLSWGIRHLIMCGNILHQGHQLLDHIRICIDNYISTKLCSLYLLIISWKDLTQAKEIMWFFY